MFAQKTSQQALQDLKVKVNDQERAGLRHYEGVGLDTAETGLLFVPVIGEVADGLALGVTKAGEFLGSMAMRGAMFGGTRLAADGVSLEAADFGGEARTTSRMNTSSNMYRMGDGEFGGVQEGLPPEEQLNKAIDESKIIDKLNEIAADDVNSKEALNNKLSILERMQSKADQVKTLENGTVRYYDKFRPALKVGDTVGSRFVVEHNSLTGDVRTWNEMYDELGNVNRMRLKGINGFDLDSPHFPPTYRDLLDVNFGPSFSPTL